MDEIKCPVAEAARKFGAHPALIDSDRIVSYTEYDQLVTCSTSRLSSEGLSAGGCIGILSDNSIDFAVLVMACLRMGIIASPLSTRLPASGLASQIERIQADALICSERQKRLAGVSTVGTLALDEVVRVSSPVPESPLTVKLGRPATVIFTSGSSGVPKGVLHPYGNHYYSALGSNENIPIGPGDRWLLSLPLYHVGGLAILFRAVLGGGAVVIDESDRSLADTIVIHNVTHLSLVYTQLQRLFKDPIKHRKLGDQLKAVLLGGSGIPTALLQEAKSMDWHIYTSYGMTEMASQITTTCLADLEKDAFSSGRPLKFREVKISDDGEILVRGETMFRGYVNGPNVTRPFDSEGWFATSDMGYLSGDGDLIVTGRKDNMFISGGENIYPEEIESALCSIDSIAAALVVAVRDEEFGFRPVAFVKTAGEHDYDLEEITAKLGELLPRFKIPTQFYPWPADDASLSIKPDRQSFQALADMLSRRK